MFLVERLASPSAPRADLMPRPAVRWQRWLGAGRPDGTACTGGTRPATCKRSIGPGAPAAKAPAQSRL